MKITLLGLLAATACAGSLLGQNSSSPAGSGSLTKEERDRAVNYLKETEKNFLTAIDGVSDAQWKFKAAPDRWSIAETAEHIAVAEDFIWGRVEEMMKAPANPEKRAETEGKDKIILDKIPDRARKAQAPEALKPTGKFATREDLVKHFTEARAKDRVSRADKRRPAQPHRGQPGARSNGRLPMGHLQRRALKAPHRADSRSQNGRELPEELGQKLGF